MKKIISLRVQISLEFSLLVFVTILSSIIVSYYLIKSAINVKDTGVEAINTTANNLKNEMSVLS